MRHYRKKELLDTVSTLKEVNNLIGKQGKGLEEALSTLSQCQESAIVIGNYLESQSNIGEKMIKILENYCESLYQMNMVLQDNQKRRKISNEIHYQLNELESTIKSEIPDDKRKIVFFVYKASMWDSMESIWKEAVQDNRCNTYVVQIPYFEKNTDGTLGEMYFEGDLLPDNVVVTDWVNFNPSEIPIDVAYIHNPYDNCNKITCVHPRFFVSELKKYVNKVVYVPYFVTMNHVEEHLSVLPGVLYSDAVVVQTENVKNKYLTNLDKFENESGIKKVFSRNMDKFCVFGSPKVDKVLSMRENEVEIPESWKKYLYREDGIKRKVVLYNTSVQELLTYKDAQIKKIEQVIALFEHRKDMVLLWRPHPLNKSTIHAMLPQLLNRYIKLVDKFKADGKGIYDDTADLHRAIAISDAYYGTGGSLIPLFGLTGKPVLKQNCELGDTSDNQEMRYVSLENAYMDKNNSLWFSSLDFNGLFKYDIEKDELCWMGRFPDEGYVLRYRYSACEVYGNKIFFPPYAAKEIAVYDIGKKIFEKIPINDHGANSQKTYAVAQHKNMLFCFGGRIPAIICLNMDTYQVEYFEDLHTELTKYFSREDTTILNRDVIVEDNVCWLTCGRANIVVEFHMDTRNYLIHRVGKSENSYAGMSKFDDKLYLIPRNAANIVCWDYKNGNEHEIFMSNQKKCVPNAYSRTCVWKDELWLFAFMGQYIGKIKKGSDTIEIVEDLSLETKDAETFAEQKISWVYVEGDNMYYYSCMDKKLCIRNMISGQLEKRILKMSEGDFAQARVLPLWDNRESKNSVFQFVRKESTGTTLACYLDWINQESNLYSQKQADVFLTEIAERHTDCGRLCHRNFNLKD